MYKYGMLRTDDSWEALNHNSGLLGAKTLGIEVTFPNLAAQCGLGNIDPQHGTIRKQSSAVEEALVYNPLPKDGTALVTIRLDKDSLGAMAVLTLRAEGQERYIDRNLVRCIGLLDSMGIENARREYPELFENSFYRKYSDAIQQIVIEAMREPALLAQKIGVVASILKGSLSPEEMDNIIARREQFNGFSDVEMHGKVAFVHASKKYKEARDWANRRFPIAVIHDPEFSAPDSGSLVYERWSIVRRPGYLDRDRCERAINQAEAEERMLTTSELKQGSLAWGGPTNIISSPPGKSTKLTKANIISIVRAHS
ncbi:MAG: hypothetical protein HYT12_04425 [Candidatus Liptonbacteria bacterium]|nr:hypothetical protein [Candidatus Liptonbacteria bacterium]